MSEIGFSISDDIRAFVDFYADQKLTTASAIAKKGMIAEMLRHPLQQAQMDEYEETYGKIPSACVPVRARGLQGNLQGGHGLEKETYAEGVEMTKSEYSVLCAKYTKPVIDVAIQKVSAQQIKSGKNYSSPRGAILQWGIRAALEDEKRANPKGMKREAPPAPVCDVCGKPCERDHAYWSCVDHGRRENVG